MIAVVVCVETRIGAVAGVLTMAIVDLAVVVVVLAIALVRTSVADLTLEHRIVVSICTVETAPLHRPIVVV